MLISQVNKRIRILVLSLILIAVLVIIAAGCQTKTGDSAGTSGAAERAVEKEAAKTQADKALADKAVDNLGSERVAALAVLLAWDRGYSFDQIIKAVVEDRLGPGGKIRNAKPAGRPQNYLKLSGRPILLAAADMTVTPIKIKLPEEDEIGDVVEEHKAAWTAWILGVVAKGYSVEQVTMYMLEEKQPAIMFFPYAGPIITKKVVDPATGKWKLDANGDPVKVVVRPEFPPKGSAFNPGEIDGAAKFTNDLAKDFEDLLDGNTPVKPAAEGESAQSGETGEGERASTSKLKTDKSGARFFDLKLSLPSHSEKTLVASKLTMTIGKNGQVSGSYSAEVVYSSGNWRTVENGTFAGKVADYGEAGKVFIDLDGTRKGQTFVKGKLFRDNSVSNKLVTGTLKPDYSRGKGHLYGAGDLYEWRIGP